MIPAEIVVGCIIIVLAYLILYYRAQRDALRAENASLHQRIEDLNNRVGTLAESIIAHDEPAPAPRPPTTTQTRRPRVGDDIPR